MILFSRGEIGTEKSILPLVMPADGQGYDPDPEPHYFWKLDQEPWMTVDAHSGGMEDQNGALEGL